LLVLVEADCGGEARRFREPDRFIDVRNPNASRLLAAFAGNFAPAFDSFRGGFEEAFIRAGRLDGEDGLYAQLGNLFDHPFEPIEFEERDDQDDRRKRRAGVERFDDAEGNCARRHSFDFGEAESGAVSDLVTLAGFGAEDSGEMVGILAFEGGAVTVDAVHEEAAAGHVHYLRKLMIAHLRGILLEKHPNQVIVETGGVGYDVTVPVSTFTQLPGTGEEVRLRIYTHVREDALQLFGFASADEKNLFEKLISVSGVGPTLAIKILSGATRPADLILAIRMSQMEKLVRIPGIGKKTAERLVLELRDKMPAPAGEEPQTPEAAPALSAVEEDVLSALVNLGSARPQAETAIRKAKAAGAGGDFEALFRRALEMVR
jgi:Holliday junction DNA helicase RuvA